MSGRANPMGLWVVAGVVLSMGPVRLWAVPMGAAFTYQGRFTSGGSPASGAYDFAFTLFDAATDGNPVGSVVAKEDLSVADGYFTTTLDFGSAAFAGEARWLQIAVRPGAETGAYTTLTPRHELTPTPYTIHTSVQGTAIHESNGNVGIGTASPMGKLHIADVNRSILLGYVYSNLFVYTTDAGAIDKGGMISFGGNFDGSGNNTAFATIAGRKENGTSGNTAGYLQLGVFLPNYGVMERMRILSNGNVGIGTTNPNNKLHIDGGVTLAGAGTFPGDGGAFVDCSGLRVQHDYATPDLPAVGLTVATSRMAPAIYAKNQMGPAAIFSGNVGIGTTAPGVKLDVSGTISCVSLVQTSDEQLKTEVQPLAGVLDKLDRIRAISFQWNEKAQSLGVKTDTRQIGVLAQEVEQVFPELVTTPEPTTLDELLKGYPEQMLTEEVKQRLQKDAEKTHYKAVNYGELTVVLLEAVKELKRENVTLRVQNDSLEKRLARIEDRVPQNAVR